MVDRSRRWADGGVFAAVASHLHSKVGPRLNKLNEMFPCSLILIILAGRLLISGGT
jgi:hypothetical protein